MRVLAVRGRQDLEPPGRCPLPLTVSWRIPPPGRSPRGWWQRQLGPGQPPLLLLGCARKSRDFPGVSCTLHPIVHYVWLPRGFRRSGGAWGKAISGTPSIKKYCRFRHARGGPCGAWGKLPLGSPGCGLAFHMGFALSEGLDEGPRGRGPCLSPPRGLPSKLAQFKIQGHRHHKPLQALPVFSVATSRRCHEGRWVAPSGLGHWEQQRRLRLGIF